jgi:dolichol-phosphate mannosyltransferase
VKTEQTPTACIVLPTYNEAQNIRRLLDELFEEDKKHPQADLHVLVVDDSSPDGTADVVRAYPNKQVSLLLRKEKAGLGAAYVAGMSHCLNELNPHVILEMDADFSHDPRDVFRLIDAVLDGADFVIGSRYVDGGSIPDDWGFHRKLISKAANGYTRTVLNIKDVKDCTGGFRAIRASALATIDLSVLDVKGYVFQVSLLDAFIRRGYEVREIPIAFSDRAAGHSKMRAADMFEGGMRILELATDRWLDSDNETAAT